MSLPYSSSTPATFPRLSTLVLLPIGSHADLGEEKMQECFKAAKYLKQLLEFDIKPRFGYSFFRRRPFMTRRFRDILTRQSFLNAIVIVTILGGSTNAVRRLWLTGA
jgi:dihydroxy-acid dehydratase